jgi:hypothetical protein
VCRAHRSTLHFVIPSERSRRFAAASDEESLFDVDFSYTALAARNHAALTTQ